MRHLDWSGLDVLELGAGMGAVSRFLAEEARSVTVVEGTEIRYSVLSERLRDLSNWSGVVANIQSVKLPRKFDVVCVIGVLEYSELYVSGENPFLAFLEKASSFLKPGGVLLLAIENKLGLKYWSGAAEDHSGALFDGICGYPSRKSPKTFSRRELKALVRTAGFTQIEEQFPFPDYKIPSAVMTLDFLDRWPQLASDVAATHPFRNYGLPRVQYFPDPLALRSLAGAGLLADFSNSFLFLATRDENSDTRRRLLRRSLELKEKAWHYSIQRRPIMRTVFQGDDSIRISKESPDGKTEQDFATSAGKLKWKLPAADAYAGGESPRFLLCKQAYFGDWEGFLATLGAFLDWSLTHSSEGEAFAARRLMRSSAMPSWKRAATRSSILSGAWRPRSRRVGLFSGMSSVLLATSSCSRQRHFLISVLCTSGFAVIAESRPTFEPMWNGKPAFSMRSA